MEGIEKIKKPVYDTETIALELRLLKDKYDIYIEDGADLDGIRNEIILDLLTLKEFKNALEFRMKNETEESSSDALLDVYSKLLKLKELLESQKVS